MNKLALSAIVASLAITPVLSQAAQTDGVSAGTAPTEDVRAGVSPTYGANINPNWQENFFVAGQLGQTQYRDSELTKKNSVFQNVRVGWRWNGIIGPEIGYAYLGRPKQVATSDSYTLGTASSNVRAVTVGLNGKFNVYKGLFVTAHGGYLRSQSENKFVDAEGDFGFKQTNYNNGWYAGLGVGYDLTRNFSVALSYDNYHVPNNRSSDDDTIGSANAAVYSAMVEYRF